MGVGWLPNLATQEDLSAVKNRVGAIEAEMLTGADRQQAVRVQLTPNAQGQVVYVFPRPYAAGTVPAVQTTAETPSGVSYRNDASVLQGSANETQVTLIVQRVPQTLVVGVLGAILNVFTPVTTPVWVNIFIRAPV